MSPAAFACSPLPTVATGSRWHEACVALGSMKPAAPPHDEETHAEPCGGDPMPAKTRSALDAFGYASLLVAELNGRCTWHSALARSLMSVYFSGCLLYTSPSPRD